MRYFAWLHVLVAGLILVPTTVEASEGLRLVENEFRTTIRRIVPAAVTCRPLKGGSHSGFSSGVIVSPDGLVLSDGDAGVVWVRQGGRNVKSHHDDVVVRVVRGEGKATTYRARVIFRDRTVDTSLLRILNPPRTPLPFVPPGRSDQLRVGDFALTLGTTLNVQGDSPATLTAGLVSAFTYLNTTGTENRYEFVYTSAAINEGVNGGPLVDLRGRLVGTVSTFLDPEPDEPFQFLGKAVPIDRVRHAMRHVPDAQRLFANTTALPRPALTPGRALEEVFFDAARRGAPPVVSLAIRRRRPISPVCRMESETLKLPRYEGAVSGISISHDGYVVTSLHNLTNLSSRVRPIWKAPTGGDAQAGIADVLDATIHYKKGVAAPARLVGTDLRTGIALWRADLSRAGPAGSAFVAPVPLPAPRSGVRRGNFVLGLGNPFGADRAPSPLLTMGILSKLHPTTAPAAWRGQWQTDASVIDTNAGGAAVDTEGRIVGMLTTWHPIRHGRHSGIAFVVPWDRIVASVAELQAGREPRPAMLGVMFGGGVAPVLVQVTPGSAAAQAHLQVGDRVRSIDGVPTPTIPDAVEVVSHRFAGETLRLTVERGGRRFQVQAVLQAKPR